MPKQVEDEAPESRKRLRDDDGKGKADADDEQDHENVQDNAENGGDNSCRRTERQQGEALDAAEKTLEVMAVRLWDESSALGAKMKEEFKVLYTTLIAAGRMPQAMKLAADVAVAAIASRMVPEAELIMNDEDLPVDAKEVFDREVHSAFSRMRREVVHSSVSAATSKVIDKGATPKQYPDSAVASKEFVTSALQDFFGAEKWDAVSENVSENKLGGEEKRKKKRNKFSSHDETRFFQNLGSFLAKRGLIDIEQVTCETAAQQAHWWAAFWGDMAADKPNRWRPDQVESVRKAITKRLGQARSIFYAHAERNLRILYPELPKAQDLSKMWRSDAEKKAFELGRDVLLPDNKDDELKGVLRILERHLQEHDMEWNKYQLAHALFFYARTFDGYPLTTTAKNKAASTKDPMTVDGRVNAIRHMMEIVNEVQRQGFISAFLRKSTESAKARQLKHRRTASKGSQGNSRVWNSLKRLLDTVRTSGGFQTAWRGFQPV